MTNLKDERLQVLKMVEEGKITSEEGINLFEALDDTEETYRENKGTKWLKVRICDKDDKNKVNVTIPVALIDVGMKIAGKVAPNFVPELKEAGLEEEDLNEIFEAIKSGASGKIVDIESEDGEKVEVIVE